MLQAQSLPDTGWPTYCLSPLFFLHNSTHQIHSHHHHSVSSAPTHPPTPSFLLLVLFERIRRGSIICRALRVVTASLASWPGQLSSISRRTGWGGRGSFGRGISCSETRNSKWRRLELRWPFSFSDKLTATPPGSFPLSLPLYLSILLLSRPLHHQHTILSLNNTESYY